MSDCFFNLRILWWHIQAKRGSLWAWSIYRNSWWQEDCKWIKSPVALYECNFIEGWHCRKDGVPQSVKARTMS